MAHLNAPINSSILSHFWPERGLVSILERRKEFGISTSMIIIPPGLHPLSLPLEKPQRESGRWFSNNVFYMLKILISLKSSTTSSSYTFLKPGGDKSVPFRDEASNCHHVVRMWVSVLIIICYLKKLLWWLCDSLNYGHSSVSRSHFIMLFI